MYSTTAPSFNQQYKTYDLSAACIECDLEQFRAPTAPPQDQGFITTDIIYLIF